MYSDSVFFSYATNVVLQLYKNKSVTHKTSKYRYSTILSSLRTYYCITAISKPQAFGCESHWSSHHRSIFCWETRILPFMWSWIYSNVLRERFYTPGTLTTAQSLSSDISYRTECWHENCSGTAQKIWQTEVSPCSPIAPNLNLVEPHGTLP